MVASDSLQRWRLPLFVLMLSSSLEAFICLLNQQFLLNFSPESSFLFPTCLYSIIGFKRVLQCATPAIIVRVLHFLVRLRWALRVTTSHTFSFSSVVSLIYIFLHPLCKPVQWFPANVCHSWYIFWHSFTLFRLSYCAQCLYAPIWKAGYEAWAKVTEVERQSCQFSLAWKLCTTLFQVSWCPVKIKTWTRMSGQALTKKKQR